VSSSITQVIELRNCEEERFARLLELLGQYTEQGKILVFVNSQEKCSTLFQQLLNYGYLNQPLHGDMQQVCRKKLLSCCISSVHNLAQCSAGCLIRCLAGMGWPGLSTAVCVPHHVPCACHATAPWHRFSAPAKLVDHPITLALPRRQRPGTLTGKACAPICVAPDRPHRLCCRQIERVRSVTSRVVCVAFLSRQVLQPGAWMCATSSL
jgi:hypothetical protein